MRPLLVAAAAALCACAASPQDPAKQPIPTSQYETRTIDGWTVHVNRTLLGEAAPTGGLALRLLEAKLFEIGRVVPAKPLAELRKVPIWLGLNDGPNDRAQYHPSRDWLEKHGFNPDKTKGVEIGNAAVFLRSSKDQPQMVLHELAHGYHDRVLRFDHAEIREAFDQARKDGKYESVLRISGARERHYALTDPMEYFAEGTEAWFGTNDFYPFVRAELQEHDPKLHRLLGELWK